MLESLAEEFKRTERLQEAEKLEFKRWVYFGKDGRSPADMADVKSESRCVKGIPYEHGMQQ
jgi:hypothetical protein